MVFRRQHNADERALQRLKHVPGEIGVGPARRDAAIILSKERGKSNDGKTTAHKKAANGTLSYSK